MMTDKAYEMFSDYEDVVTVDDVMKKCFISVKILCMIC